MTTRISINGVDIVGGRNIVVQNNRIIVDGMDVTPEGNDRVFNVTVTGDVDHIENTSGNVHVTGAAGSVATVSGDVRVGGSVSGSVKTISGDVTSSGRIGGSVSTVSGDIRQ